MYCDWPQLGRCCFCLPLRRGVLTFGYINLLFSVFLIGVYSFSVHHEMHPGSMYHGITSSLPAELCVAIYCLEVVFNTVLVYGAHKKSITHIRAFYYFAIATITAPLLMAILDYSNYSHFGLVLEMAILISSSLFLNLYLVTLVRSLIRKLEIEGPNLYDNPLHQIVTGEAKAEHNGIYNDTTVEPIDV